MHDSDQNDTPPTSDAPPVNPDPAATSGQPNDDEKTMAMLCHLLTIFTWFMGPLLIWLLKKDSSRFVDQAGKEALNWCITLGFLCVPLLLIGFIPVVNLIACFLWPVTTVLLVVFGILASIATNKGEEYRYPLAVRLIG